MYLPMRQLLNLLINNLIFFPQKVCAKLKGRMMQAGTIMVGYQPDDRRPNFFRNIISSAAVTERDVDFLLSEIDRLGHDIIVD